MANDDVVQLQAAQAAAVKAALTVLLDLYPDSKRLSASLAIATDHLMSQWLNSQDIPDGFVVEFQRQMEEFQKRLQQA